MLKSVYIASREIGLRQCVASLVSGVEIREIVPATPENSQTFTPGQIDELSKAEILLADPPLIGPILYELKNLKWMQSTWAGVDSISVYVKPFKPKPTFILSRIGDIFGPYIAEYTIAQIISHERQFRRYWQQQKDNIWQKQSSARSLRDLTLGIIGVGSIGSNVAELAKNFGMATWGLVNRDLPSSQRSAHIDVYKKQEDLSELLSESDYVCSVLPRTEKTKNLLSGDVLKHCQCKKSVFINVGRGDVIDDCSILAAIRNGWITAAILDVFNQEPLPEDHPFWTTPEIVVTPHVAGPIAPHSSKSAIAPEIAKIFSRNIALYKANKSVEFKYDWNEGY